MWGKLLKFPAHPPYKPLRSTHEQRSETGASKRTKISCGSRSGVVRGRQGSSGVVRSRQGSSGVVRGRRGRQGSSGSIPASVHLQSETHAELVQTNKINKHSTYRQTPIRSTVSRPWCCSAKCKLAELKAKRGTTCISKFSCFF